ncbi:hypothetical protein [Mycobacterium mantenii]|uniref:Uncharacterized protein n=1 Tax=Mycobacterium mantenii TaxID=560555 RepID=A0A1A2T314_MYCNT|nr:hypothetical protein [Mycobacterium mantenii]OBH43982.1 hypothetical protein A5688_10395 [Mycobacterium mantenii]OBH70701.1 hypothetical protein A5683_02675 [Mycobacterium mantenii]
MSDQDGIIERLRDILDRSDGLSDLLEQSLVHARATAESQLRPDLFAGLEWPTNAAEYEDYLEHFIRWVHRWHDAAAGPDSISS